MVEQLRRLVLLSVLLLLAQAAPSLSQNLPDVGGRPFRPEWGTGTTLRAEGADLRVFVAQDGPGDAITAIHLSPSRLDGCYGGASRIIWVLSEVLKQPNVQLAPAPSHPASCLGVQSRSVGAFQRAFEPGSNGSRHIAISTWTNPERSKMQGVIHYESDAVLTGVCGGAVIGLVDSAGRLLHYYTPPTGCVNGKFLGGSAERRFVTWEDNIPAAVRDHMASVTAKSVFTEASDKGNNVWEALTKVADKVKSLAEAAAFLGTL